MAQYLLLYHCKALSKDKRKLKARKDSWDNFISEISNTVLGGGKPLVKAKTVTEDKEVGNGDCDITGFTVVEAEDLDEAVELSRSAPDLNQGGRADVFQIVDNTV